jgi:hypothetical protein
MTRRAIVFLRDGRSYQGAVSIADGFVHFDGDRRIRTDEDHVMYRQAGGRTWPRREIRELRWLSEEPAV